MVKSMTGFGRGEYTDEKRHIVVEIRSVNHRYSDISIKMPRRYSFAEDQMKNLVKGRVRRGKVDLSVTVDNLTEEDTDIRLNVPLAEKYCGSLTELADRLSLEDGKITVQFIAALPDVMKTVPGTSDEEEVTQALLAAAAGAVDQIDEMRKIEGEKLAEDILMRGELIRELTERIADRAPLVVMEYKERLRERIGELLGKSIEVPEERIVTEAAIFADKCNITEELVRLRSHTLQLRKIISESTQPDGKKLDFLVQEMNREANTIGSKANDIEITNRMLELKAEIEKIREQVQNIE